MARTPRTSRTQTTNQRQPKIINLALQGGGSHGAFAWGVLDYLLEDGRVEFEGISATSAGAMNAVVLAQGLLNNNKEEARAAFRILSDLENGYALSLNLAIWVGAEMEQSMSEFGCDLPRYQGNTSWFLPIPATFVVATDGIIRARFVDPDYRRRMDLDDLITALQAAGKAA